VYFSPDGEMFAALRENHENKLDIICKIGDRMRAEGYPEGFISGNYFISIKLEGEDDN
jgi:hypothetical protein